MLEKETQYMYVNGTKLCWYQDQSGSIAEDKIKLQQQGTYKSLQM